VILALETGWPPETLADLPDDFRRACHWALYARALSGPEGLAVGKAPPGASAEVRAAHAMRSVTASKLRAALFPEDD
jgi:hypothetical protein